MNVEDAKLITQNFLDRQGEVTISGDVEATLAWCNIPCSLETMRGQAVAKTENEMRTICVAFINDLKKRQVTHMVRTCIEAKYKDPRTIWATYETRFVGKGNSRYEDPYPSFVILNFNDDRWKISSIQFAVDTASPVNTTLMKTTSQRVD